MTAKGGLSTMGAKRYYWIKLRENWFKDKRIKKLRSVAGGDTYTVIYLKMQLLSLQNEGYLYFDGVDEDFITELALDLDEDPENVRVTCSFLQRNGLLEMTSEDEYLLTDVPKAIGSEGDSAHRMRDLRQRAKEKASLCDHNVQTSDIDIDIEKEKNIETEKEKEKEKPLAQLDTTEVFIELPLNDGTFYQVSLSEVSENKTLFPNVDVEQQYRSMRAWLNQNPTKRKTRKGIGKFIVNWLSTNQDNNRGGYNTPTPPQQKPKSSDWEGLAERLDKETIDRLGDIDYSDYGDFN